MKGVFYGAGVGPGDPELITLKARRIICENGVIAFPGKTADASSAYLIARLSCPGIDEKTLLPLYLPMTRDGDALKAARRACADKIEEYLERGENVVFLTLGDPDTYSTFSYLRALVTSDGYRCETVCGAASFSAAAARLGAPLAEGDEKLLIVPSGEYPENADDCALVFLKPSSGIKALKEKLIKSGRRVRGVERCGMEGEKTFDGAANIPEDAGYFTVIIAEKLK